MNTTRVMFDPVDANADYVTTPAGVLQSDLKADNHQAIDLHDAQSETPPLRAELP